jgi:hypothetical protein
MLQAVILERHVRALEYVFKLLLGCILSAKQTEGTGCCSGYAVPAPVL